MIPLPGAPATSPSRYSMASAALMMAGSIADFTITTSTVAGTLVASTVAAGTAAAMAADARAALNAANNRRAAHLAGRA
jgi:hypothetical protein